MTYPQFMESCNLDLPLNDQIPYRLWSRRAARKSHGRTQMLHTMMEMNNHLQAMNIEEHRTVTEPVEKLEEILQK